MVEEMGEAIAIIKKKAEQAKIVIPDEAEVLIGSARLEPAGVVVWKEKSDNKYK